MSNSSNNRRIFKNTLFLYFRMLLTLGVTLYTSRVVLNNLGVEDFGIYNVVGGVVTMMAFLSGAMSSATQRFLSFELGKKDTEQLHNVFKMSINIHWLIIFIVVLIAETLGLWFVNTQLVIPSERLVAANWVYQCAIISFCCSVLAVPYNAAIIAHEKMSAFAYISIVDVLLKLIVVFWLAAHDGDKLQFYALLLSLVSVLILGCYYAYARWQFEVTRFGWYWNTELFKTLFSYTGWNLFGNVAAVAANQGINILLNLFFGATVNAARAIAFQVNSAITGFVTSLQMSINPQIVKSFASDNHTYMLQLVFSGARYSFFLLYMLAIPLLLQTEVILKVWLGILPEHAVEFCRLVIIDSLIVCLSGTLMTAFQATGKIKKYQMVVGFIILCNLPVSYLFLKLGCDANVTMFVGISISMVALCARVILLSALFSDIKSRFIDLITRVSLVFSISLLISNSIPDIDVNPFFSFLFQCVLSWSVALFLILTIGINKLEQQFIANKISTFIKKF
ncbi:MULTISPECIES: lipopolysaccharide biosynthesis protein [Enterobacterales]|jgi:O-antigen/teichoic acid export membrane protein|uniref:Oligosaccharide flippase family protein n=1 Tax=Morganella morganii TaxID=582 RepID=A0AAE4JTJ3_MORMO|nr:MULTISPECIES: oligosaccharide flippase family protein [Enterobacterales]HBR1848234.1 oligosaccharide flippase family protein [Klebsiella quasipneumoniae subsp. quasipneumoniae]EFB7153453.1 oligosaccharide flippase family protein [Escherichia coli]ELO5125245.1 oligosaccharide flippase family protein [Escherichia coli]ELZ3154812.1 oligosaccharide flippase family protein [Klebsiella pneumoniae]MBS2827228.1 oligosaccharide flippase family protein [Klebsiella pneumoniae]